MNAELIIGNQDQLNGSRWGLMLAISVALHLSVLSAVIFIPGLIPSRDYDRVVYEVDLVTMPSTQNETGASKATAEAPAAKEAPAVKRIEAKVEKKAQIEVDKIPLNKKAAVKKEAPVPSRLLDKALADLEKKVKSDEGNRLDKAISELEKKTRSEENNFDKAMSRLQNKVGGTGTKGAASGTGSLEGIPIKLYQMEVETRIKGNWTYLPANQNKKDLEATVLLKVREDGTILKSEFKKKSKDSIFDQSVLKAIERSNPLPAFPEGYKQSYEEFEINFNLKDLAEN